LIEGVAVTPTITTNGKSFNPAGCELSVPIPLLFEHETQIGPIGEVVYMRKSETEIFIRATLWPDECGYAAWELIKIGELTGLSIGIGYGRGQFHIIEDDSVDYFTRFKMSEVSVCFHPSNPDCRFRIYPGGAQKMIHPSIVKARETIARLNRRR
jgi:HK97 family phage prohead protease